MPGDDADQAVSPAVTEDKEDKEKQPTSEVLQDDSGSAFSSMESLADMTLCPVHFGRLDRPKLLPCGHVFCMACLDKWSEQQQQHEGGQSQQMVECPMCRRRFHRPESGAAGLPTSAAHQAILEYLVTHAAKQQQRKLSHPKHHSQLQQQADPGDGGGCLGDSAAADEQLTRRSRRNRSLEMRQDLLTQISVDLVRRADTGAVPEAFNREELAGVRDNLSRVLQRLEAANGRRAGEAVEASENNEEDFENEAEEEEAEDVYEAEIDRAPAAAAADAFAATQCEMRRLSRYQLRELPVEWNADADDNEDLGGGGGSGGIAGAGLLLWRQVNGRAKQSAPTLVLLGENSRSILVERRNHRRRRRRRFTRLSFSDQLPPGLLDSPPEPADIHSAAGSGNPGLERRLRVASIQAARGVVYLTGWIGRRSLLAIVSLEEGAADGGVLRCHAQEEATEAEAALGFAGFHVEPRGPAIVVAAQPGRQRVEFFGEDLQPTGHWLVFDRLTPRHVAWASQSGTLWVSCPDERLVLAVNDRTGVFRKLSTGEIFQSPPAHIVAGRTPDGDCRVVLADPEQGRLYWIRKRRKYIFLQRLQVTRQLPGITSLSALDNGQLLVTSRDRLFQLKPVAGAFSSTSRREGAKCELL